MLPETFLTRKFFQRLLISQSHSGLQEFRRLLFHELYFTPSTLIRINLESFFSLRFDHGKTLKRRFRSPKTVSSVSYLKTPARWCSVERRKRNFSKRMTSNAHVITVTVHSRFQTLRVLLLLLVMRTVMRIR